jgi:hypothetical protein
VIDWLVALTLGIEMTVTVLTPPPASGRGARSPQSDLDRIAVAVEGVESSGGRNPAMWQPKPSSPQGPMQVSLGAALDVGGGNRFDTAENRQLGRSYLALLFKRYGNWRDALIAYNWGPANLDRWTAVGRPVGGISAAIVTYLQRVATELRAAEPAEAPPAVAVPTEPPPPQIHDLALRKTYLDNRAEIAELRGLLISSTPDDGAALAETVLATLRSVARRPGYGEFAIPQSPKRGSPASQDGLKQIAVVLVAKLEAECAAIVLVDQHRHPPGNP